MRRLWFLMVIPSLLLAQTSALNTFKGGDNDDPGNRPKSAEPWLDITRYGGYVGPNYNAPATTCSIRSSSRVASCASVSDFSNGNGILILGAGPVPVIATPQAPVVIPFFQTGSTTRNYCVADRDWAGGLTPCSPVGRTSIAPASMTLASYSISSWSWNQSTQTMTITTSADHNMPTSPSGISSEPYAQVEIQGGSTGNGLCEGAFSLTAVPSARTLEFERHELKKNPGCTGGTLRIQPQVILKWDSHYTYNVKSASCSGGTATLAISPGLSGPGGTAASTWVVPWNIKAIVSGVSDARYNGAFRIAKYGTGQTTLQYSLGSCSGATKVGAGGTISIVPGKAVKNHLIYECTGSSCALPANAANYALVGVAQGNDGYFIDRGWPISAASVDAGDAPADAPTRAIHEYLDTTIVSGSGTTSLTLAIAAATTVSGAKAWHDNVPNLLAACAALPATTFGANGGHIVVPAASSIYQYFPIIANFDMTGAFGQSPRNCPGTVTIDFGSTTWLDGAIMLGKGHNIQGFTALGATNCQSTFYQMGPALGCFAGNSYPMVYFEPEQASSNWFKDVVFNPNQAYQSGLFIDEQMNGDGTVSLRMDNVHVNGAIHSYPLVDRAGFGRFWNYGGWSNGGGNFSESINVQFQPLCGMPSYQPLTTAPMPYIITTNSTYSFGTIKIDSCGLAAGTFGTNVIFNNMLTETPAGPAVRVTMVPYGLAGMVFNGGDYADLTGGYATPYLDLTNASVNTAEFLSMGCATSDQPLFETSSAISYRGIHVVGMCAGIGYPSNAGVIYETPSNNQWFWNNMQLAITGAGKVSAGQIATPSVAPTVTVSTSCTGHPSPGTYTYGVVAWDASSNVGAGTGGATTVGPASSGVTLDGTTQCAIIMQPALPAGTAYWGAVRLSGPGSVDQVYAGPRTNGINSFVPVSNTTITDQTGFTAGSQPNTNTTSLNQMTASGFFGALRGSTIGTILNCNSTASPAACGDAPAGLVQVAASATTLTVNTTAVTANSRFAFTYVTTGKGCSAAPTNIGSLLPPYVSAISPGKNFTITLPVAPTMNVVCVSFLIEN